MSKTGRQLTLIAALLLLFLCSVGCWFGEGKQESAKKVPAAGDADAEVALFFCDRDGHLTVELRSLTAANNLPEAALAELMRGPETPNLLRTIPEDTKLRGVVVRDGVARADFSAELIERHWGGSLGETITVYSITNTQAQFPDIDRVQILIEGQEIPSLTGHLDLTEPLWPDLSLVKD